MRRIRILLSVMLGMSLVTAVADRAVAEGPSVGLPEVPSVPVEQQTMQPRPPDQASTRELRGNQPPGSVPRAGGGTPTATSLSASATWSVSAHTGDFQWAYPLRVPPAPGGLEPTLALSYSSSTLDGRTSAANNQASWVGDGWDLDMGFVERAYGVCALDKEGGTAPETGDLCWRSDNATAAYNGGGGMLIRDDATGVWRPRADDGARVERLTGAGNPDDNGEHWKITTADGTQYFYGSRPESNSTWTVPVYGDDEGEPCHGASFGASRCTQAWRWNLDKVVDAHGNTMLLSYVTESNAYGANLQDAAVSYIRGGTLRRVEYGLRPGVSTAVARVEFGVADRCVPGSACTLDNKDNWPDTALAHRCEAATCRGQYSPTFWTTKRLSTITTQVYRAIGGTGYSDVDRWTLEQGFPDPGDGEKAALWLKSITHTGLVGGEKTLPAVTFEGAQLSNRVYRANHLAPLNRYRITGIVSESGGVVSVNYAQPDCVPGASMPANPEINTHRCFPVRWDRGPGYGEQTDYFHKYVVASVVSSDRISSSLDQQVAYEYLDGAAWHYDTSEFTPPDRKTWNEFRGFARVKVHSGRSADPAGPITTTEHRYFRGMERDPVSDSEGVAHTDHDWLRGFELESSTAVTKSISEPHWQGPTATRGAFKAYIVRGGVVKTFTTLDGGGRRITKRETGYDDRGLPTWVSDVGNVDDAGDDLCTRTEYVRNPDAWLLSLPSRVHTVSVHCGATPVFPDHAVSDNRNWYDEHGFGAIPATGNVTKVEVLAEHPASGPEYAVASTARYDEHGRVTSAADALGRTTTTTYTPALGGPATKVVVLNPLQHKTTTTLEPGFGLPLKVTDTNGNATETGYDPLGRAIKVWLPDRPRSENFTPSSTFEYDLRREAPTVVTQSSIGPRGNYFTSKVLYDGMLRVRQAQAPAVGGGRLLTDTRYDSQGRVYKSTTPYFNNAAVDSELWSAADSAVPGMTVTHYDSVARPIASVFAVGGIEKWRTAMTYSGDRVHVTPPAGGTPTTRVADARGRIAELLQQTARTRYTYTPSGRLATLTDPAGNAWRYAYDLRGRLVRTEDPDKGTTTSTYDAAGQLLTQTDARGQVLAHDYDPLGRQLWTRSGSATGRMLAQWTYDTVRFAKGMPATATAYDAAGNAYTTSISSYNARYQPGRTAVTIPESEGLLAGTYQFETLYNPDGSVDMTKLPGGGGLFAEDVVHTYDDAGRPLTMHGGPEGTTVHYVSGTEYTRYGERQRLELGSGTRRAWVTDLYEDGTHRRKRSIVDGEVPRPMQADLNYTYDAAGNVTSIADTPQDQPADVQCFRYDQLRRLTEAWTPGNGCTADPSVGELAGPAQYWQSFRYDPVGNRTMDVRHTSTGDVTRTYTYPAAGATRPHAVSTIDGHAYEYDAVGNLTRRGAQQLTWDGLGHLASVTGGSGATEFVYAADGERLIRREAEATTLYLGAQELRLHRATGVITGTRYYAHGGDTVAVRTPGSLTWLAADHHGTATVAINSTTLATDVRRADPFGNPRGPQPSNWPGEQGFVGGTSDASTGLTHLGAREYDPGTGRFISVDPILDPGDPQQLNAYAYANNNPTTFSDPTGLIHFEYDNGTWSTPYKDKPPPIDDSGCDGRPKCAYPSTGNNKLPGNAKINQPAQVKGKPGDKRTLDKRTVDNMREFGYRGSDQATYGELIEFAAQGDDQFALVCLALGGHMADCTPDDLGEDLFAVKFAKGVYELTAIADFQHCFDGTESCLWILTNAPGANVLKALKPLKFPAKAPKEPMGPPSLPDNVVKALDELPSKRVDMSRTTAHTGQPRTLYEEYWHMQVGKADHLGNPGKVRQATVIGIRVMLRLEKILGPIFGG